MAIRQEQGGAEIYLPIQAHFSFSDRAPAYLSDLLDVYVYSPSRQFHSCSDSGTLNIPHVKTKVCVHAQDIRHVGVMFVSTPRDSMRVHACV